MQANECPLDFESCPVSALSDVRPVGELLMHLAELTDKKRASVKHSCLSPQSLDAKSCLLDSIKSFKSFLHDKGIALSEEQLFNLSGWLSSNARKITDAYAPYELQNAVANCLLKFRNVVDRICIERRWCPSGG